MTTIAEAEALCREATAACKVGDWLWHINHKALCEPLTEPPSNRIDYIVTGKPEDERLTRLTWMRPVAGELPPELVKAGAAYKACAAYIKAGAAYIKAGAAYDKAYAAYDKAYAAYDKAYAAAQPALEALHATEHPGCPWNGTTLLPEDAA